MHLLGIINGKDLKQRSIAELKLYFGKAGKSYYLYARGEDYRPVNPIQETQSVSAENTFQKDIYEKEDIKIELDIIIKSLLQRLQQNNFHGKTIAIKLRYTNFTSITRSKTFSGTLPYEHDFIEKCFWELFNTTPKKPIRLIDLTIQTPDHLYNTQISLKF